jgi:hypothetical protein
VLTKAKNTKKEHTYRDSVKGKKLFNSPARLKPKIIAPCWVRKNSPLPKGRWFFLITEGSVADSAGT